MRTTCRASTVVCLLAFGTTASGQETLPRPEDLVAAYRQNRSLFQNVRLVWLRRQGHLPGWYANVKHKLKWEEERAAATGEKPEAVARHQAAAENYRKILALPESALRAELLQEYLSDRANSRFQMRAAPDGWVKEHPEPPWGFPRTKVDGDTLRTVYEHFFIYSFDKAAGDSFRAWAGQRRNDTYLGSVLAAPRDSPATFFPPLAVENQQWGKQWHPFDEFFATPVGEMNVVGRVELEGHPTYILELLRQDPFPNSYLPEGRLREKYKDRYKHMFSTRAWVDPARGGIPLRITWDAYYTLDGRVTQPPGSLPQRVLEQVVIDQVAGAGYYPVKGVVRESADDESVPPDFLGSEEKWEKIITGERPLRARVWAAETAWQVGALRVNCVTADDLQVPFPEKTLYTDEGQRKTLITGENQALLDGVIDAPGKQEQFEEASATPPVFSWLLAGNLVSLALLGSWFLFRRRPGRRKAT